MSIRGPLALLAGALLLGACGDITVPDYTSPPLDDLTKNPTVERVKSGAVGLQIASRLNQPGYVLWTAMVGREAYFVDPNEPRYMTRIVQGTPSGANFTGNVYWALPYRNVRNANILVAALERVEMPAADEEAVKGFARTIQALEYLQIVNMRDSIPIYVNSSLDSLATQPPFAARRQALEHVSALLDSAAAQLRAAGASFPFDMASGFTQFGFNTPARFLHFNRGLKARAETYLASPVVRPAYAGRAEVRGDRARYAAALQALGASFLNTAGTVNPLGDRTLLNAGVYQTYGSGSGDQSNGLYDPSGKTVAERGYRTDAELRPDGQRDARYVVKIDSVGVVTSRSGVTSELRFAIYDTRPFYGGGTLSSPIPIIRNEELVLLRAEARWFTGDRPGALQDIDFIRRNSGGLRPTALTPASTDDAFVTELLAQRRYSLMFEGGHRWIDARRFGRLASLQATSVSVTRAGARSPEFFPVPTNECLPREGGC